MLQSYKIELIFQRFRQSAAGERHINGGFLAQTKKFVCPLLGQLFPAEIGGGLQKLGCMGAADLHDRLLNGVYNVGRQVDQIKLLAQMPDQRRFVFRPVGPEAYRPGISGFYSVGQIKIQFRRSSIGIDQANGFAALLYPAPVDPVPSPHRQNGDRVRTLGVD